MKHFYFLKRNNDKAERESTENRCLLNTQVPSSQTTRAKLSSCRGSCLKCLHTASANGDVGPSLICSAEQAVQGFAWGWAFSASAWLQCVRGCAPRTRCLFQERCLLRRRMLSRALEHSGKVRRAWTRPFCLEVPTWKRGRLLWNVVFLACMAQP